MSSYWSKIVHQLDPYVPGEQPQDKTYIKLNTNENPYPPSEKVSNTLKASVNEALRLYPDPTAGGLIEELAAYYDVKPNQVFVGNGSDEVLAFSFQAFFEPGNPIIFPDITYSFYPVYCGLYMIDFEKVPLTEDFSIPLDSFNKKNGGIIFPNPNAPTGKYLPLDGIRAILEKNRSQVVIVDEAYIDFGGESAVALVNDFPNLLVIQTFSKSRSLAGLRIGFAIGSEELIEGLNRIKNSFNSYTVDRLAMVAGIQSLKDKAYFEDTRKQIIKTREDVTEKLAKLGFTIIPSKANFIFITHGTVKAKELYDQLKEMGILVRYFPKKRIENYLRITIGTAEEMEVLVQALTKLTITS